MNFKKSMVFALATMTLGGCAATPPTPEMYAKMDQAKMPDEKQAERAVKSYLENVLIDPESARYQFRPLERGITSIAFSPDYIGVFMCGTVNAKNRLGGYTGQRQFIAYFDPATGEDVQTASIESPDGFFVEVACRHVYGF